MSIDCDELQAVDAYLAAGDISATLADCRGDDD